MMNQYLKNLNKIEFVVTYACTGRCKHCSEGDHTSCGERIDPGIAADAVRKIAMEYDIKTVMAFGGEPLLYTDAVYAIMNTAKELNIPKRQVITNGYFSKNADKIREVAERLATFGVNDLLCRWMLSIRKRYRLTWSSSLRRKQRSAAYRLAFSLRGL